jgi:glycosyltransferase involved in cell wall biosynthesis
VSESYQVPDQPTLSVVIPIRNRSGIRLENCLRALRWQTLAPEFVEIVLSDFGSDAEHATSIETLSNRYGATVVSTDTTETWNRSRALNIGLQAARGERILCTDADMLFAPDFLSVVMDELNQSPDEALVVCRCRDLPSEVPEQLWSADDFDALKAQSPFREAMGTGACHATSRAWFESIRGYDERYVFWGFEDLVSRAEKCGLRLRWIHNRTSMLHQWHRTLKRDKIWWKYANHLRFLMTRYRVEKNPGGWGNRQ